MSEEKPGNLPEDFVGEEGSKGETEVPPGTVVVEDLEGTPTEVSTEGTQTEFTHALLQGKKGPEIDRVVSMLEAAVQEQGKELSRLHSEQSAAPLIPEPAELPSQEDYFNNPGQVIRDVVQKELRAAIEPFKQDLAKSTERDVWATVATQIPDFADHKPLIEVFLQKNPNIPVTVESLTTLYYTAKGYVAANQGSTGMAVTPTVDPATPPPAPPQHAASSHPIPQAEQQNKKRRPLTENEKLIARSKGWSDEKYLSWLELTEDEVLTAEIS
jgi:hypothetical protein